MVKKTLAEALVGTPDSGSYVAASPESLAARRRLAETLIKGGADYSPVQSWTQGMARVAQALSGVTLGSMAEGDDRRRVGAGRANDAATAELLLRDPRLADPSAQPEGGMPAAPATPAYAPQLPPMPPPSDVPGVAMAPSLDAYTSQTAPETAALPAQAPTPQPGAISPPATQSGAGMSPQMRAYIQELIKNPGTRSYGMELMKQFDPGPAKPTDDIREYEFARGQGYQGSFADYQREMRKSGATTVNVGPTGIDYGQPDKGLVWARNPDNTVKLDNRGAPVAVPYQGGPVYREQQAQDEKAAGRAATKATYADIVTEDIDRAVSKIDTANFPITGLGSITSGVPGTAAHDLQNLLNTVRANIGFDRLQLMRESSPTGGALGAVSDFENRLLQATYGALEQSQSKEQLTFNLKRVRRVYEAIVNDGIKPGDPIVNEILRPKREPAITPDVPEQKSRLKFNPATGELE